MEILGGSIPRFEGMLVRDRLIRLFHAQAPVLTVVCAGAGYGKTVLASQLATESSYDTKIWVQLPDIDVSGDAVLERVASALDADADDAVGLIAAAARPSDGGAADVAVRIHDGLERLSDGSTLLIIDGANEISHLDILTDLSEKLCQWTSGRSRLVMTCRRVEAEKPLPADTIWLIEADDLRFTSDEIGIMLADGSTYDVSAATTRLLDQYRGHPAITRIMLRHPEATTESRPTDLVWQVERIVSRLKDAELAALYLAALLCQGRIEVLQQCATACDLKTDWMALADEVPLFHVACARGDSRVFRTHAVLSEVAARQARHRMSADEMEEIRGIAFQQLATSRDHDGLGRALDLFGTEVETAHWCSREGVSMLRYCGHAQVERLLGRLSPLTVASSSSLLLLRAHVQRACNELASAVESTMMSKRLAEVNGEHEDLVAAALLLARLRFDEGRIDDSRLALESVGEGVWSRSSVQARCLRDAYLSAYDAQSGMLAEALERTKSLREALRPLDAGSDEVVFATNCVGSILSQCKGDWESTASLLAPLACRSDIAPLQREHIRSNYAVALAELGEVSEAQRLAESVVARAEELGLDSVGACAASSVAELLWIKGDLAGGFEMHERAEDALRASHDTFALAGHGLSACRVLRAIGERDLAQSLALNSATILAGQGVSAHMAWLMARIEVAASSLSLGDIEAAAAMIADVTSDPATAFGDAHLLKCDLLSAEILRLSGRSDEAVKLLRRRGRYISSGSSNMLLACYVSAFPGLLQLLAGAFGPGAIPARALGLLSDSVVQEGLSLSDGVLCSEDLRILRQRCESRGAMRPAQTGSSGGRAHEQVVIMPTDKVQCRVRLFGRLEVDTVFGHVEDRSWRKWKARTIFLMLTCKQGCEVPRDVILEHLWPHMDAEHALRNFYVTWSTLRRALSCGQKDPNPKRFVISKGGVCRVTDAVVSDIPDFEGHVRDIHEAARRDDVDAAISAALALQDMYQGGFLPAYAYEACFESLRMQFNKEFCDGMLAAARCALGSQQYDVPIALLRSACLVDPWREDLYQTLMICQMQAGQRGGAIETYNICRARLAEDLGIDPSEETKRIFKAVLAMDGEPEE